MRRLYKIVFALLVFATFSTYSLAEEIKHPSKNSSISTSTRSNIVGNYHWIIYDNVCPYCKQSSKYIKELDWEGKFKFISYRDPITYIMFPFLTEKECEKDVHMVTPEGKVLVGYKVFRAIIDNLTATKILNPLLKNSFAENKLNEMYEKMVKKRTCYYEKTESCSIEDEDHTKHASDIEESPETIN